MVLERTPNRAVVNISRTKVFNRVVP